MPDGTSYIIKDIRKQCGKCKTVKELSEFGKDKNQKGGLKYKCLACCNIEAAIYRTKNRLKINARNRAHAKRYYVQNKAKYKVKARKTSLKWRYGITEKEYLELFRKQNGKCAICDVSHLELDRKLAIDHCHKTSKVRGLLCNKCNLVLGNAIDNENILLSAIQYLREHKLCLTE